MPTIRLNDPDPAVLDGRHIRASAFETAQRELLDTLRAARGSSGAAQLQALVIGAGYSLLPRLVAAAGYQVTALDCSVEATDAARELAADALHKDDAPVDYRLRDHVQLIESDDSYDLVWCIDTLEIEADPRDTLIEIARVARPGSTIVLDTLSNTFASRAIYLGLFQRFPFTRVMPPRRYLRERLLTPTDLTATCEQTGITIQKIIGYEPGSPIGLLKALLARRRGSIQDSELGDLAQFRLSTPEHAPPVTFYAIATPHPSPTA